MDVQKTIPEWVWVGTKERGKWQKLEIEDRPDCCQKFKKLGHKPEMCQPQIRNSVLLPTRVNKEGPTTEKRIQKEWTLVTRRKGSGLQIREREEVADDGPNRDQSKAGASGSKGKEPILGSIPQICSAEEEGIQGNEVAETSSKLDSPKEIEGESQVANLQTVKQAKPCEKGIEDTDKEKGQSPSLIIINENNQEDDESGPILEPPEEEKEARPVKTAEKGIIESQMEELNGAVDMELTEQVKISSLEICLTSTTKEADTNKANDQKEQGKVDKICDPGVLPKSPERSSIRKTPSESNLQGMTLESEGEGMDYMGVGVHSVVEGKGTKVKLSPKVLKIAKKIPPPSSKTSTKGESSMKLRPKITGTTPKRLS